MGNSLFESHLKNIFLKKYFFTQLNVILKHRFFKNFFLNGHLQKQKMYYYIKGFFLKNIF